VITKATTKLVSRRNLARRQATRARTKVRLKPKSRKDWAGLSGEWSESWQDNQGTARAGTKSIQLRLAAGGGATSPSQPNKKRPGWQAVAIPKLSAT
jgi:Tfp pilus assembly protein FimT